MKEVNEAIKIVTELKPYFLQKNFFVMLINCWFNKKCSKISANKNVNNSSICTFVLAGVGM
jgi:hypothetical protein